MLRVAPHCTVHTVLPREGTVSNLGQSSTYTPSTYTLQYTSRKRAVITQFSRSYHPNFLSPFCPCTQVVPRGGGGMRKREREKRESARVRRSSGRWIGRTVLLQLSVIAGAINSNRSCVLLSFGDSLASFSPKQHHSTHRTSGGSLQFLSDLRVCTTPRTPKVKYSTGYPTV